MAKSLTIFFVGIITLVTLSTVSNASHVAAVNITYLGVDTFRYVITVKVYRDCRVLQGVPSSIQIDYSSVSCSLSGVVNIPLITGDSTGLAQSGVFIQLPCLGIDSCDDNISGYAVEEFIYRDTLTLPDTCVDWILSAEPPGFRNASDVLIGATSNTIYVSALLNNVDAPANNSPTFEKPPLAIFCVGNQFFFNQGATEIDGDSLVYSLAQAQGDSGVVFNYDYVSGFDYLTPFNVVDSPLTMDPINGIISFTPDTQPVSNFTSVINVLIEEYNANGILIGSIKNDMQVFISDSCDSDTLNFTGDTTTATGTHPAISALCKANKITVHFDFPVQCETISLDASNFILTLPIGGTLPVTSIVTPICTGGLIDSLVLILSDSMRYNGTYFVYDTIGSNGTPLLSECGLPLNDTLEIRLRDCVKATVDLLNVTVVNNSYIQILWAIYTENFSTADSDSVSYNILRSLNPSGIYDSTGSTFLLLDTIYSDFNVAVTDTPYNYMIDMILPSKLFLAPRTDSIQSMLLTGVESILDTININLSWTRYWGWPSPTYRILQSIDNGAWAEIGVTNDPITTYVYTKPLLASTYRIMIRTEDNITGLVSESNWIEYIRSVLQIPNAITPNDDGINDFFFVNELLLYKPVNFIVYDRWGIKVFEDDDYDNRWDGDNLQSRPLPEGTYFYVLDFEGAESEHGFIVIIR
ncbi:MAG TPA: gliding motility-associated C-terminal domain-containing protein [Flavobacteriales bacterium]|nr:gliding motility-associated C-terminal domain-containing protein [Flavobacteriales bacterium]HIA10825.1 gliding motility-associated C-terminal domain-containing protein [Flavobacteriales bacterium]